MKRAFKGRQLSVLLSLSLCADVLVKPFDAAARPCAQIEVWAALAQATALTLLFAALAWLLRDRVPSGKAFWGVAFALFLCTGAAALYKAERFYRYTSDVPLLSAVTLGVLLAVALYALCNEARAFARTAGLLVWLFAVSLGLLLISNARGAQLTNLAQAEANVPLVWQTVLSRAAVPAELVLYWILDSDAPRARRFGVIARAVWLRCGLAAVVAVGSELVLGTGGQNHVQALHTLARIGGISVFKRLDAFHAAVWLLLLLLRAVWLLYGVKIALLRLLPQKYHAYTPLLSCALALPPLLGAAVVNDAVWRGVCGAAAVLCLLFTRRENHEADMRAGT